MANDIPISQGEFSELIKRVEWLDEERRKSTRKLAELEQRLQLQEREISGREQRIQDLERQLAATNAQLSRIPQVDVQLEQFKDDIVEMIEQYDQRRLNAEEELDRLRRIEHEGVTREIIDIRKELPAISRLQHEMELRKAEEARLSNLIGTQTTRLSALNNQVESWPRDITFLDEKEKQNSRNIADMQNTLLDINRRWNHLTTALKLQYKTHSSFKAASKKLPMPRKSCATWYANGRSRCKWVSMNGTSDWKGGAMSLRSKARQLSGSSGSGLPFLTSTRKPKWRCKPLPRGKVKLSSSSGKHRSYCVWKPTVCNPAGTALCRKWSDG